MTNKIATKQYCNTIQSNSFTDDLTRCPRHEDIVNVGLLVTGLYRADQLIPEDVISANINYITVSATRGEGNTYTLNPGVSTYVGMATGDILLEFRNYK